MDNEESQMLAIKDASFNNEMTMHKSETDAFNHINRLSIQKEESLANTEVAPFVQNTPARVR